MRQQCRNSGKIVFCVRLSTSSRRRCSVKLSHPHRYSSSSRHRYSLVALSSASFRSLFASSSAARRSSMFDLLPLCWTCSKDTVCYACNSVTAAALNDGLFETGQIWLSQFREWGKDFPRNSGQPRAVANVDRLVSWLSLTIRSVSTSWHEVDPAVIMQAPLVK